MSAPQTPLSITCFSDYICPFCYVMTQRLRRLAQHYPLELHWVGVEIHPDTPPAGRPLAELGLPEGVSQQLKAMMAAEELEWANPQQLSNSRQAHLLMVAAQEYDGEVAERLHQGLFQAYQALAEDIGEPKVLTALALAAGMPAERIDAAWQDEHFAVALAKQLDLARLWQLTAVPALRIGERLLVGAVDYAELERVVDAELAAQGG